jgi:hypothetical protein
MCVCMCVMVVAWVDGLLRYYVRREASNSQSLSLCPTESPTTKHVQLKKIFFFFFFSSLPSLSQTILPTTFNSVVCRRFPSQKLLLTTITLSQIVSIIESHWIEGITFMQCNHLSYWCGRGRDVRVCVCFHLDQSCQRS